MDKPILITCINCSKEHIYDLCDKGYIVKEEILDDSSGESIPFLDKVKEYIIRRSR